MHNKLKLFTVLLASCYFGSSVSEGRTISKVEIVAAQCVIDLVEPSAFEADVQAAKVKAGV